MNVNFWIIAGRLTADPEFKQVKDDFCVADFSVAINKVFTKNGKKEEQTTFIDCTAVNRDAEMIAEHFSKGQEIFLSGEYAVESWEDKEGGTRRRGKMRVRAWQFVGSKKD